MKYVYMGNVARERDTRCPECKKPVAQRSMMGVRAVNIDDGKCRHCGGVVDGVWISE